MDGEFPENFKCPICFEIPEKEIYQCENGHIVCDSCVEGLSLCPQCKVNLITKQIRNRGLEELFDMMKFNCSFKSDGCSSKVARKEISSHSTSCEFGGERMSLCNWLGYKCNYKMRTRNLHESLGHLKQKHSILSSNGSTFDIKIGYMKSIDRKMKIFWKPVLLNVHSEHHLLVISTNMGNISFVCLRIGGDSSLKMDAKFRIASKKSKVPPLEWTTKPIRHAESELALKTPPVLISLDFLLSSYIDGDELKIEVVISENDLIREVSNKKTVELEPFRVFPLLELESMKDITDKLLSRFSEPIGDGHYCNVCRIKPIRGPRYRCLQCWDYDLCSSCMANNEHSFHHFTFLCSIDQFYNMRSAIKRGNLRQTFFESANEDNLAVGYIFGSISAKAKDLRCLVCENQPDFMCLHCGGAIGLCRFCFFGELERHDKSHFFVITITDSARQFVLHILRNDGVLPCLKQD